MTDTTYLIVERTMAFAPATLFEILSDPKRHVDLDGSGLVRSDDGAEPITAAGQMFTMRMHWDKLGGDYRTENHVTAFERDAAISWQTADAGTDPAGWEWRWTLEPRGEGETHVTLTYDWSAVTDPDVLARVPFPVVSQSQLEESLDHLEAAAR